MHTATTPGGQYIPFSQNLQREIARRLGILFEAMTMDFRGATYSSVRMGASYIWPTIVRRRSRGVAPLCQGIYEAWLDEAIARGIIPFKGGYRAFTANRQKVFQAEWQGPAKPSADDEKSGRASELRLQIGVSSMADECAEYGRNWEEVAEQRARERAFIVDKLKLPDPFIRITGGGAPKESAPDEPKVAA
jgi:capsid protein